MTECVDFLTGNNVTKKANSNKTTTWIKPTISSLHFISLFSWCSDATVISKQFGSSITIREKILY